MRQARYYVRIGRSILIRVNRIVIEVLQIIKQSRDIIAILADTLLFHHERQADELHVRISLSEAVQYCLGDVILIGGINVAVEVHMIQLIVRFHTLVVSIEYEIGQIVLLHGILQPACLGHKFEVFFARILAIRRDKIGDFGLQITVNVYVELVLTEKRELIVLGEELHEALRLVGGQVPCVDDGSVDERIVDFVDATLDYDIKLVVHVDEALHIGLEHVGVSVRGQKVDFRLDLVDDVVAVFAQIDQFFGRFGGRDYEDFPIACAKLRINM